MGGLWTNLRNLGPLSFGFLIGALASLLIFPYLQKLSAELCSSNSESFKNEIRRNDNVDDNYDPVVHSQLPPSKPNAGKKSKLVRPRFFATELGVKDKLCVTIIIEKDNLTFATSMNKTVAHHVNRLVFFSDPNVNRGNPTKDGDNPLFLIPIPGMADKTSKFYFVLTYVVEHFINNYDWFYFVTDSTYVKAFKLYEFATHLSAGFDVILGKKSKRGGEFCSLTSGMLISHGAMKKLSTALSKCKGDVDVEVHEDPAADLEKCVRKYAGLKCNEEWNGRTYKSWDLSNTIEIDSDMATHINSRDSNNQALTVSNVNNAADVFRLHKHFCNLELDQINQLMTNIEESVLNSSAPAEEGITWPAGLPKASRPRNRYEMFRWDFFTLKEIFEISNDRNVRPLDGINKKDIDNALDFAIRKFKSKHPDFDFIRLLNGYRKFDPTRGMDYILDLQFRRSNFSRSSEVTERVHLLRALSRAEIVPAPYVTEAARVLIVVPVFPLDSEATGKFLSDYTRTCLETDENSRLVIVLFYSTIEEQTRFRTVVREVESLKRKFAKGDFSPLDFYHVRSSNGKPTFDAIDFLIRIAGADALYFVATPQTEIRGDFLNRVRMNTIMNFQVFFPVPFVRYHPKLVGEKPDVSKTSGHFDRRDFTICSFYGVDYLSGRRRLSQLPTSDDRQFHSELIDLFFDSNLHIMRTADPALLVNYVNKICDPKLNEEAYSRCFISKKEGLASKSQLAALILERGIIS